MKGWQWLRLVLCVALTLAVIGPVGTALGATVNGRSSTVVEWFDDPQEDTALPVYEYLQLNVRNLGGKGIDFKGYGRVADDLRGEVDVDSRLYYGYLEKDDIGGHLDLRLGRQFIVTTAGASVMDGIHLDYRDLGALRVALFGGGDVTYFENYSTEDLIVGGEVSSRLFDRLDLELSYLQKWDDGELSHELIGFSGEYVQEGLFSLYNETQYSWLTEEVTYLLAGAKFFRSPKWSLRGEYLYSLPVFSSTSIFSVFAADEYEEALFEANYNIDEGLRAFARYTREMYQSFEDADVYEAGVEKIRTDHLSGYLTGILRDDEDGQDLKGFKVRAAWLFNQRFQAGLGLHLDVLERRIDFLEDRFGTQDETTSKRYWADATVFLGRRINVEAKVERVESALWEEYYRGRVRLNVLF